MFQIMMAVDYHWGIVITGVVLAIYVFMGDSIQHINGLYSRFSDLITSLVVVAVLWRVLEWMVASEI